MILSEKTLEVLREIINDDGGTHYKKGQELVSFFNKFGFHDSYDRGFPSRWIYTESKLNEINGTPDIDACIKTIFAPIDYIEDIDLLDNKIDRFNKYLAFDGWKVIRTNTEIAFERVGEVVIPRKEVDKKTNEQEFLEKHFTINTSKLGLEGFLIDVIDKRLNEIKKCVKLAPLSATVMIGGVLEGVLYGIASKNPRLYNTANSAPREKDGSIKKFDKWTLNDYIDVSYEIGVLNRDVKEFSYALRDFRNYIHPYKQLSQKFDPDERTATICFQVLKAAFSQIEDFQKAEEI